MQVLITGGAGFLGSHLCERYLQDGHEVLCLDSLVTGSRANIEHLAASGRFSLHVGDVGDVPHVLPDGPPIDLVLHFASPASPPQYMRLPFDTLRAGSTGLMRLLDLTQAHGARLVFASTSEVYGEPLVHPQHEGYWGNVNPVGVRAVYDESKRFGEMLCTVYRQANQVNAAIIRIFNTYGPRMQPADGRVVPNLICQALRGEPLTVYGDGTQTRSFCYVDDLVEGIVRMAASGETGPINLGNPAECTVGELASMVLRLTESTAPVLYRALPSDDPTRRRPDITQAQQRLAWQPQVSLEEGLSRTIAWHRQQMEHAGPDVLS